MRLGSLILLYVQSVLVEGVTCAALLVTMLLVGNMCSWGAPSQSSQRTVLLLKPQHFCFAFFQCADNITGSMSPHSAGGSGGGFLGVLSMYI